MSNRETWGSKAGFILAAAGSAIGLGNIWKFPYVAGSNGGGAFLLIYIGFVILIGFSVMLAELTLGRNAQKSAVGAFKSVDKNWSFGGILGVISGLLIMGFYPVVGGWSLAYIFKSLTGLITSGASMDIAFEAFQTDTFAPFLWMLLFLGLNLIIVTKGIQAGIEKISKILMPVLFAILIIIALYGVTISGAMEGVSFLFKPKFEDINSGVVLAALGQAFFSLSLGMGTLVTYGSYLDKKTNLVQSAGIICFMDTAIAILAGLAIFPALFAFGISPDGGPGLVFIVLPTIFVNMGAIIGTIMSVLFFIALTVAALTSSVSILEVVASYFIDEKNFSRKKAVALSSASMLILCVFASLSVVNVGPTFFGVGAFDLFDLLTDKVFLALGGVIISLCVGWKMDKNVLYNEITNEGELSFKLFNVWLFLIRVFIPVVIGYVAYSGIKSSFDNGYGHVMVAGIVIFVATILTSFISNKMSSKKVS